MTIFSEEASALLASVEWRPAKFHHTCTSAIAHRQRPSARKCTLLGEARNFLVCTRRCSSSRLACINTRRIARNALSASALGARPSEILLKHGTFLVASVEGPADLAWRPMTSRATPRITGLVSSLDSARRAGFVRSDDYERDIFFRLDDLGKRADSVRIGTALKGTVQQTQNGPRLVSISLVGSAPPAPYLLFSLLALIAVVALSSAAYLNFEVSLPVAYLVGINISALFFMGLDKSLARSSALRLPEAVINVIAVLGGSAGVLLGIQVFRHKTRKAAFQFVLFVVFIAQFALLRALGFEFRP